jgi:hypothetical protein
MNCIEKECVIEHDGKKYESGGAFIVDNIGAVYGDWNFKTVSNWHGTIKIPARYGKEFKSNMGDKRRHVWFKREGKIFHGVWCAIDNNQLIMVKAIKD